MQIIALSGLELAEVERGADGLPRGWPLLRVGDNLVTRSRGMPVNLRLTPEDLASIVEYHEAKGAQIPIDCQHVISNLAIKLKIDEAELVKRLPRYTGVAGFGHLEVRGDALCMADVEWLPIGREVMMAGQFRYYSPTVRGLDGQSPLRVTSVALTNTPHLQNVADLAAGETGEEETLTPEQVLRAQEEITVTITKEALMPDSTPTPPGTPAAAPEKKADAELLALLREVLGDDVTPENIKAKLLELKGKAAAPAVEPAKIEAAEERLKKLELAEETRARKVVIDDAFRRGRLTPATLKKPFIEKLSAAELADYVESLPADGCAAPVGTLQLGEDPDNAGEPKTYKSVAEAIAAAPVADMKR